MPYEDAYLPAVKIPHQTKKKCGTIVIHGGFDSFIEEFYSVASYFAHLGYDVVMFDGPGQGGALKEYNLPIVYNWEKR